jgi:UDP-2,3-diacylglucosamine pyrophosphatase LpxH
MTATKRAFISDVHLGIGEPTDWYKKDVHDKRLLGFFDFVMANAGEIKDLVLVGDIFDTWVFQMDKKPPTIQQILEHNSNIITKLKDCVGELQNVFYLNGNHDMHVSPSDLADIKKNGSQIQWIREYRSGALYAVHGHNYAMFNARDSLHDPGNGYPLGYYISRILAGDKSYTKPGSIVGFVDDLLEAAVTTQTISESVVEALMEHRGMDRDEKFIMPGESQPVAIKEIKKRYTGLFDRWVDKFGFYYSLRAIKGELGSLGWFADRICKWRDYKVVIMGHTHDKEFDPDPSLFGRGRIYANPGYWCGETSHFVLADKKNGSFEVSLIQATDQNTYEPVDSGTV